MWIWAKYTEALNARKCMILTLSKIKDWWTKTSSIFKATMKILTGIFTSTNVFADRDSDLKGQYFFTNDSSTSECLYRLWGKGEHALTRGRKSHIRQPWNISAGKTIYGAWRKGDWTVWWGIIEPLDDRNAGVVHHANSAPSLLGLILSPSAFIRPCKLQGIKQGHITDVTTL